LHKPIQIDYNLFNTTCPVIELYSILSSGQAKHPPVVSRPSASEWECGMCTFLNSPLLPECEMCTCPKHVTYSQVAAGTRQGVLLRSDGTAPTAAAIAPELGKAEETAKKGAEVKTKKEAEQKVDASWPALAAKVMTTKKMAVPSAEEVREMDTGKMAQLLAEMGFDAVDSRDALQAAAGDMQAAIEWLVGTGGSSSSGSSLSWPSNKAPAADEIPQEEAKAAKGGHEGETATAREAAEEGVEAPSGPPALGKTEVPKEETTTSAKGERAAQEKATTPAEVRQAAGVPLRRQQMKAAAAPAQGEKEAGDEAHKEEAETSEASAEALKTKVAKEETEEAMSTEQPAAATMTAGAAVKAAEATMRVKPGFCVGAKVYTEWSGAWYRSTIDAPPTAESTYRVVYIDDNTYEEKVQADRIKLRYKHGSKNFTKILALRQKRSSMAAAARLEEDSLLDDPAAIRMSLNPGLYTIEVDGYDLRGRSCRRRHHSSGHINFRSRIRSGEFRCNLAHDALRAEAWEKLISRVFESDVLRCFMKFQKFPIL